MPTLKLSDEQVLELVKQLPPEKQEALFRDLAVRSWPRWAELRRFGEERARALAAERGLDWDRMSEQEREGFADDLVHEDRPCS